MVETGFSCPSTVLVDIAMYSSANAIGAAIAPSASMVFLLTATGGTRIFNPFTSSGPLIARALFEIERKPHS